MLAEEFIYQTAKTHREEAICEAKRGIRGGFRIAGAKRSNPCYYLRVEIVINPAEKKRFAKQSAGFEEGLGLRERSGAIRVIIS